MIGSMETEQHDHPGEATLPQEHEGQPTEETLPVPVEDGSAHPVGLEDYLPDLAHASSVDAGEGDDPEIPEHTQPGIAPPDVQDIPLADIHEIANIRPQYDGLEDLTESMRIQGQLEPGMVRPTPPGAKHDLPYELVFGYRRKRAAETLGWTHLRCDVRDLSDDKVLDVMITENLQREDLSAIAEAKAMRAMIELGGMSQAAVARRLGVSASHVSHRLALLTLSAPVIAKIDAGELSASHGEVLASLPAARQEQFAEKAAGGNVSVTKLSSWVRRAKQEAEEGPPEQPEDLEPVLPSDATEIPRVALRQDLGDDDMDRLHAYVLLRGANDQEMLEYLEDREGVPYENLWDWVRGLTPEDARTLCSRIVRRYVEAGHRYSSIEKSLRADLEDESVASGASEFQPTPSLDDGDISPDELPAMPGGLSALPAAAEDAAWLPPGGFGDDAWGSLDDDTDGDAWVSELDDRAAETAPVAPTEEVETDDEDDEREAGAEGLHTDDQNESEAAAEGIEPAADEETTPDPETAPADEVVEPEASPEPESEPVPLSTEAPSPMLAISLSTELRKQPGLEAAKADVIADRVGAASAPVREIAREWLASGTVRSEFEIAGYAASEIFERLGKPSLFFSALAALDENPGTAAPALERMFATVAAQAAPVEPVAPALPPAERITAALIERQGVDQDKASGLGVRIASDEEIAAAALSWAETGILGAEPVIAGQTPSSLSQILDKPSVIFSAMLALRANPEAALARLGLTPQD